MGNEDNYDDDAVEKTLAALRHAAPPEGMEARMEERIAQYLQQHTMAEAMPTKFHWSDLFAGSAPAGAWWRGAISGAATAMLVTGIVLLTQHGLRAGPEHRAEHGRLGVNGVVAGRALMPVAMPGSGTARNVLARQAAGNPCVSPGAMRVRSAAPARTSDSLNAEALAAMDAPSRPAPILPLTEQERELIQLARTASPKVLASLNPETQARVDAADAAEFNKFFAPPPEPPQPADSGPVTKTNQNQSQL